MQVIGCYLFKMLVSYPLSNFPLRVTLHYQVYKDAPATTVQHTVETLLPFIVSAGVAVAVSDVSILFSFVGAIARTVISFMFPAAMMLVSARHSAVFMSRLEAVLCYVVFAVGVVVMVLGLAATIYFVA